MRFAERIGVNPETVRQWAVDGSMPGVATLAEIVVKYPRLNAEWVLTGKGPREIQGGDEGAAVARDVMEHLFA